MGEMDAYRDAFLAESGDYLQQMTDGLLALERDPSATEPVEVIFRGAHSLKGMSAAMGYERTADLTHKMEELMAKVRSDELAVDTRLVDLVLSAVDLVRDLIDDETAGSTQVDPRATIAALAAFGVATPVTSVDRGAAQEPTRPEEVELLEGERGFEVRVRLESTCVLKAVRAYMVIKRLSHIGRVIYTEPTAREIEDENFESEFVVVLGTGGTGDELREAAAYVSEVHSVDVTEVARARPVETAVAEGADAAPVNRRRDIPKLSESQTVRVSIGHLDTLVDLVGELVILRSRLERVAKRISDHDLTGTLADLHHISSELQYEVMQTRMVPVRNIFNRFPRMVRDLATDLGKEVEFEITGLDIELDRTVLDEIGDPIVHLLRNSIDHGIGAAEDRLALGKPRVGRIQLTAVRERDHVTIVVSDDGKGIDLERVWAKAVQQGLAKAEERDDYSEAEILLFICVPGFSTAEKATKVSGRGVGMDVVKGKIEHLGGTVRIASTPGVGTDFILQLPLTLAIVKALLVEACGETFAIPLAAVTEVFSAQEVTLKTIDGAPVLLLRDGGVVPFQRLDAILYGKDPLAVPELHTHVLLVEVGGECHALHVDALAGRQEIVIKPLSRLLRGAQGFSGATILGDGRVMLILDPRTMFSATEVMR